MTVEGLVIPFVVQVGTLGWRNTMRAYGHENDGITRVPHEAEYLIAAARKLLEEEGALRSG
jgi:hypothetical protein